MKKEPLPTYDYDAVNSGGLDEAGLSINPLNSVGKLHCRAEKMEPNEATGLWVEHNKGYANAKYHLVDGCESRKGDANVVVPVSACGNVLDKKQCWASSTRDNPYYTTGLIQELLAANPSPSRLSLTPTLCKSCVRAGGMGYLLEVVDEGAN